MAPYRHSHFDNRIRGIFVFFVVFAMVLIGRLFFLQTVRADMYRGLADDQYVRPAPDRTDRGTVFFTYKTGETIAAATLGYGYRVIMDPSMVDDPANNVATVASVLPSIDVPALVERASDKTDRYEVVAHRLDNETAERINNLGIAGIGAYKETWRVYPGGSLAAHVLGFVGYQKASMNAKGISSLPSNRTCKRTPNGCCARRGKRGRRMKGV